MASSAFPATAFKKFKLNNEVLMPAVGVGTFRLRFTGEIMTVVDTALGAGYRMFDTASVYGNEHMLGEAFRRFLPKYGLTREDIFVTTKLAPAHHGESAQAAYFQSLRQLNMDYVDLYLVHFPGVSKLRADDKQNAEIRDVTWMKLSELYLQGRVRAIGVSNYTIRHLDELISNHRVIPAVNQVEWHPYYHQPELMEFCKERNIVIQAYSSFGGASTNTPTLLHDVLVNQIARKLNVSVPQLLLAWALQQGVSVIPKSVHPEYIKQNIQLDFVIPTEDIKSLNRLNMNNVKYAWDPTFVA